VRPLEGLVPQDEIETLYRGMTRCGGILSEKQDHDGRSSTYEINISYFDAMRETQHGATQWQAERFLCSQTIMLAFKGIPAIYFNTLAAKGNDYEGVEKTGRPRAINRKKWDHSELKKHMAPNDMAERTSQELKKRFMVRKMQPAFHPDGGQEIMDLGKTLFAMTRTAPNHEQIIHCISNITAQPVFFSLPRSGAYKDLLSGVIFDPDFCTVEPYQTVWLTR
jgi:sucrose phosphorylase